MFVPFWVGIFIGLHLLHHSSTSIHFPICRHLTQTILWRTIQTTTWTWAWMVETMNMRLPTTMMSIHLNWCLLPLPPTIPTFLSSPKITIIFMSDNPQNSHKHLMRLPDDTFCLNLFIVRSFVCSFYCRNLLIKQEMTITTFIPLFIVILSLKSLIIVFIFCEIVWYYCVARNFWYDDQQTLLLLYYEEFNFRWRLKRLTK